MSELQSAIQTIFDDAPYKIILSKPTSKQNSYKKISILPKKDYYQAECFTEKQAFHFNYSAEDIPGFCESELQESFLQLNAWSDTKEYQLMLSKKGKVSFVKKNVKSASSPRKAENKDSQHNRSKNYLLLEGENIPPLVDMGIFTKDGKIVSSMYDKYKQINRFLEIIDDSLRSYTPDSDRPVKIVDFGCGKSYLTFVLYYFLTEVKKYSVTMIGLDLKEDVIRKCNQAAKKYGYVGLSFQVGDVGCYKDDVPADMIITLHACDTATDYALFHAIQWNAKMIFSVPCCQHELNQQFRTDELNIIGRYGIVKERTMALMTDAIRSNLLECCGYKTNLMEFVDFENTPKNLLIRAVKKSGSSIRMNRRNQAASRGTCYREVEEIMKSFHLKPTLYHLLDENGYLSDFQEECPFD